MTSETVTKLTTAFKPDAIVDQFIALAPFILGVVGTIAAVGLVSWGIKKVTRRMSRGV